MDAFLFSLRDHEGRIEGFSNDAKLSAELSEDARAGSESAKTASALSAEASAASAKLSESFVLLSEEASGRAKDAEAGAQSAALAAKGHADSAEASAMASRQAAKQAASSSSAAASAAEEANASARAAESSATDAATSSDAAKAAIGQAVSDHNADPEAHAGIREAVAAEAGARERGDAERPTLREADERYPRLSGRGVAGAVTNALKGAIRLINRGNAGENLPVLRLGSQYTSGGNTGDTMREDRWFSDWLYNMLRFIGAPGSAPVEYKLEPGQPETLVRKAELDAEASERTGEDARVLKEAKAYADAQTARVYRYMGTVQTVEDLPDSAVDGNVYNVAADGMNYAWSAAEGKWDALGGSVDLSAYVTTENADARYVKVAQNSQNPQEIKGALKIAGVHFQGSGNVWTGGQLSEGRTWLRDLYQRKLTWDAEPTEASENSVKSGGIFSWVKQLMGGYLAKTGGVINGEVDVRGRLTTDRPVSFTNNSVMRGADFRNGLVKGDNITLETQADGKVKVSATGGSVELPDDVARIEASQSSISVFGENTKTGDTGTFTFDKYTGDTIHLHIESTYGDEPEIEGPGYPRDITLPSREYVDDAVAKAGSVPIDTAMPATPTDDRVPSTKLLKAQLDAKQPKVGAATTLSLMGVTASGTVAAKKLTQGGTPLDDLYGSKATLKATTQMAQTAQTQANKGVVDAAAAKAAADSAKAIADSAKAAADSANTLAGNALPKTGGTVRGSLLVTGSVDATKLTEGGQELEGKYAAKGDLEGVGKFCYGEGTVGIEGFGSYGDTLVIDLNYSNDYAPITLVEGPLSYRKCLATMCYVERLVAEGGGGGMCVAPDGGLMKGENGLGIALATTNDGSPNPLCIYYCASCTARTPGLILPLAGYPGCTTPGYGAPWLFVDTCVGLGGLSLCTDTLDQYACAKGWGCSCSGGGGSAELPDWLCASNSAQYVSVGHWADGRYTGATAVGYGAYAGSSHTVAFGKCSYACGDSAVALGAESFSGPYSVSVGRFSNASGEQYESCAVAIGYEATARSDATVIGAGACAWTRSVAIGKEARATGDYAGAIGYMAKNNQTCSLALVATEQDNADIDQTAFVIGAGQAIGVNGWFGIYRREAMGAFAGVRVPYCSFYDFLKTLPGAVEWAGN